MAKYSAGALCGGGEPFSHPDSGLPDAETEPDPVDAICAVKDTHGVIPNRGFLRQLINLDTKLYGCLRKTSYT
ncbi:unnamed protein product [Coregonus sp. 'balchen']|nr:unnamed protein product [Coregonus sp. 'balchen']